MTSAAKDIDEYIGAFPEAVQYALEEVRVTIRKAAPTAKEKISYAIPTFTLTRNIVHFAGYKNHIGFYPGAEAIATFQKELSNYKSAKGSVQFPLEEPMPLRLITKIVKYRVKQETEKLKPKKK